MTSPLGGIAPVGIGAIGSTTSITDAGIPALKTGEGGVRVARAEFGSGQGRLVYDPTHPLADAEGYVKYPDIDLGDQMTELIMAQRGYQANAAVIERAKDAYTAALQLGKG